MQVGSFFSVFELFLEHQKAFFVLFCCIIIIINNIIIIFFFTKGRILLLTRRSGSQPIGSEIPSWYSAGSQRTKGVLAAPRRVFTLMGKIDYVSDFTHTLQQFLYRVQSWQVLTNK